MIKVAIVDDEKIIREQIRKLAMQQEAEVRADVYATGNELLASGREYDVVFLDIQMEGVNGIDTARELRKKAEDAVVVFVTANKEYVFDAFDVSAFHYLLKPVEEKKFTEVFERAALESEKRNMRKNEQLFIRTRDRGITLDTKDILYVESRGKKVEIHTMKESLEIYGSMNELEIQLGSSFFRCHRGYLVNMAHIGEYDSESILLTDGKTVYMSKEKYRFFVKAYMRYLRNGGTTSV